MFKDQLNLHKSPKIHRSIFQKNAVSQKIKLFITGLMDVKHIKQIYK